MKFAIAIAMAFMMTGIATAQSTTADVPKTKETNKIIELIAGSWKLQGIVDEERKNRTSNARKKSADGAKDVPAPDTDESRNAMQMLDFDTDARYKVNNSTTAIDSGSYRINEQQGVLYLESDADDVTPMEWGIEVNRKKLTLVGRGDNADTRYKYIYTKVKEGVSTN